MIAAMLLVAAAQAVPGTVSQAEDEITVIARKLKAWRGSMRVRKGVSTCKTRKSTGDREIDAIGCAAMTVCFPRFMPRFEAALVDKTLAAEARKRASESLNAELTACVGGEHEARTQALADRRAAAQ